MPQRIAVIIPALNEEASLPLVIRDLFAAAKKHSWRLRILVGDNGSSDGTAAAAAAAGAEVVSEPRRGYGSACLKAMAELTAKDDPILFIDGDYSDFPEEIPLLLQPILEGEADFVIGSRTKGVAGRGSLLWQQRFGNRLSTTLIRLIYRHAYSDLGPFRALKASALKSLKMDDRDFGWTVQMQIRAVKAGLKIREVPVSYRKRIGTSKVSGTVKGSVMAGTIILKTIFREIFRKKI